MSVSSTLSRISLEAPSGMVAFPFAFTCHDATWIEVFVNGVRQTSGYTVRLSRYQDVTPGGSVTFAAAPAPGANVEIRRLVPLRQLSRWPAYSAFPSRTLERQLDLLTMGLQQLQDGGLVAAAVTPSSDASTARVLAVGTSVPRTLETRLSDRLNLRDFGAIGDGIEPDDDALLAAIAALGANGSEVDYQGGGGTIYAPRGIYLITAQVAATLDNLTIEGDGPGATNFKVAIAANPSTTDAFKFGSSTGQARRITLRNLTIFTDTNYGANRCRDLVYIDSGVWWRLENVNIRGAGRYGLRLGGTYDGTGYDVRLGYCGDSGLCIENGSDGATHHTTSDFYHLHTYSNWKHGIHARACNTLHLYSPIIEGNGQGSGDPTQGNGIRCGDTGINQDCIINVHAAYFEGNKGWDIHTGTGLTSAMHKVSVTDYFATTGGAWGAKSTTYGFFYGARAAGVFTGGFLADYVSGANYKTFSLDSTCKVSILGGHGGLAQINYANRPEMRDLGGDLGIYSGGAIQWFDPNGEPAILGRMTLYVGGPGAARSIKIERGSAAPTTGTYQAGDMVINDSPKQFDGPLGWRCSAGGSPGTWGPFYPGGQHFSGNRGDASVTLTAGGDQPVQLFDSPLTGARTVTLSTTGCMGGERFRVVRTAAATGADTLTITLGAGNKALAAGQWADVAFDAPNGNVWRLVGSGSL